MFNPSKSTFVTSQIVPGNGKDRQLFVYQDKETRLFFPVIDGVEIHRRYLGYDTEKEAFDEGLDYIRRMDLADKHQYYEIEDEWHKAAFRVCINIVKSGYLSDPERSEILVNTFALADGIVRHGANESDVAFDAEDLFEKITNKPYDENKKRQSPSPPSEAREIELD